METSLPSSTDQDFRRYAKIIVPRKRPSKRRYEHCQQGAMISNSELMCRWTNDNTFTALKWLARQTGAGCRGAPEDINDVVFGEFWKALSNKRVLGEAAIDVAYQAALLAYQRYTGVEVEPVPCPECGHKDLASRRRNDFLCRNCGWKAQPGSFGAAHIVSLADN